MGQKYTKNHLSITEQISLLEDRGLIFSDKFDAERFLSNVNYYRFSGYCLPFETERHKFKSNIKFEVIKNLYDFDRRLRFILDEALEIIEISMRTKITYHLSSKYGAFAHEEKSNFFSAQKQKEWYGKWIEKVHEEIERSKETFTEHYKKKYEGFPRMPLWMAVEVLSFGSISKLYAKLKKEDMKIITTNMSIPFFVFASWMHTFSYIRNICAHHSRLWNKELAIAPELPHDIRQECTDNKKVAAAIFAINRTLGRLSIDNSTRLKWQKKIKELLSEKEVFSGMHQSMGFRNNFIDNILW